MQVAVLSDVHSNPFALRAVLRDVAAAGVDEVWLAGDAFGYYPWVADTFELIEQTGPLAVLGNHDQWVLDPSTAPRGIAGDLARENARQLPERARSWLESLAPARQLERAGLRVTIAHGTPEDPLEGRYYPDDNGIHAWLPAANEVVIMGQTHYPLLRGDASRGLLVNPGSVGQPRDGDPMPSWAILDLARGEAELRRSAYDNAAAIAQLRALGWDAKVTAALGRRRSRP